MLFCLLPVSVSLRQMSQKYIDTQPCLTYDLLALPGLFQFTQYLFRLVIHMQMQQAASVLCQHFPEIDPAVCTVVIRLFKFADTFRMALHSSFISSYEIIRTRHIAQYNAVHHLIIVFFRIIQCFIVLFHGQRQVVLHMCHNTDHIVHSGYMMLLIRSQKTPDALIQIMQAALLIPCCQLIKGSKIADPSVDSLIILFCHRGKCLFQSLPGKRNSVCHLLIQVFCCL